MRNQLYVVFLAVDSPGKNVKYFPHILPGGWPELPVLEVKGDWSWFSKVGEPEPYLRGSDFQYLRRRCEITSVHEWQTLKSSWNTHLLTPPPPPPGGRTW